MHELNWACKSLHGKKQKSCEKRGFDGHGRPIFRAYLAAKSARHAPAIGAEINKIKGLCKCYREQLNFFSARVFFSPTQHGKLPRIGKDIDT
ncbi:hypothetical protein [Achromobacter spanius]|uniref:hypothetical protein n=1 Tax=Achromobacter spanius TaxID=217203 RepID=UPI00131A4580|nr:hypothetical protein [Achromobacter spanius]